MSNSQNELGKLFSQANAIGRKYCDRLEVEAQDQELYELRKEIEALAKAKGI